ncbi:hypothetical protein SAMN05661008_00930 [Alkalithermobacter thermoalcaliphilus JW-YL-7 = DSM 7308]|uniref:Uncharacterized protein n=1 Tax=Alkalithermobacter thermoalcaliphilus JW-YL-7 = DSM 7308 TaxID=1121328 RepID=A0A150FQF6_CLOPD|nr:hypothetical protein JWYL7_0924 [[Clostridium] paradoxum JW-YL-7 = DSM 7308]SHK80328.1 hypothetical protein SAMN05661008_00930 [[Clostridium] paradoxum JW-YL-7 = DSM 7308]
MAILRLRKGLFRKRKSKKNKTEEKHQVKAEPKKSKKDKPRDVECDLSQVQQEISENNCEEVDCEHKKNVLKNPKLSKKKKYRDSKKDDTSDNIDEDLDNEEE